MLRSPLFSRAIHALVIAGLLLPVTICVVAAMAVLLARMGDGTGGAVLGYVALAGGILWVIDLVALVLVQAIDALERRGETPDERDEK